MKIGRKIAQYRQSKKLSQRELAKLLDTSQSAVGLWEIDKREPSLDMIEKIAKVLDIKITDLFGEDDSILNTSSKNFLLDEMIKELYADGLIKSTEYEELPQSIQNLIINNIKLHVNTMLKELKENS